MVICHLSSLVLEAPKSTVHFIRSLTQCTIRTGRALGGCHEDGFWESRIIAQEMLHILQRLHCCARLSSVSTFGAKTFLRERSLIFQGSVYLSVEELNEPSQPWPWFSIRGERGRGAWRDEVSLPHGIHLLEEETEAGQASAAFTQPAPTGLYQIGVPALPGALLFSSHCCWLSGGILLVTRKKKSAS